MIQPELPFCFSGLLTSISPAAILSSLSSMLKARWQGNAPAASKPEPFSAGQIRSFTIT
jgi:hypothetical protein